MAGRSVVGESMRERREGGLVAIVFELVVNFGSDAAAADRAVEVVRRHGPVRAGGQAVKLHEPLRAVVDGDIEISVIPNGVGVRVPMDDTLVPLTAEGLSELARGLFAVLAEFSGYRAAVVDWDPESVVECKDLEEEYGDDLAEGYPSGLVLAESVLSELRAAARRHFEPFAPGYAWIPYRGHSQGTY